MQVRPLHQFLQGCITLEQLDQCRWPAIEGSLGLGVQFHVLVRDSNQHLSSAGDWDLISISFTVVKLMKSIAVVEQIISLLIIKNCFCIGKLNLETRYIQLATRRRQTEDLSQYHHGSVHKGNSLTTQQLVSVSAQQTLALIDLNLFCPKFGPKTLAQQFTMIQK